jgi:hypothetical protein
MSLNSKRLSLADVRLKIFNEMEADIEAQFLDLLELRERVRQAELRANMRSKTWGKTWARKPASVVIAAVA